VCGGKGIKTPFYKSLSRINPMCHGTGAGRGLVF
jgi:hypothetical protein